MYNLNFNIIPVVQSKVKRGDKFNEYPAEILLIGGGGAGGDESGNSARGGGGGAAGALISASIIVDPLTTYTIQIGTGSSTMGANGEDSLFSSSSVILFRALGGGAGVGATGAPIQIDGGSGGGGRGGSAGGNSLPSTGSGLVFNTGSKGGDSPGYSGGPTPGTFYNGGGGGGAASAGQSSVSCGQGGPGGNGVTAPAIMAYFVSASAEFAAGGDGGINHAFCAVPGANGVDALPNTGNGGGGATSGPLGYFRGGYGGSGVFAIRYPGVQKGFGGNPIVTAEGYTYHYFASSSNFISTGFRFGDE